MLRIYCQSILLLLLITLPSVALRAAAESNTSTYSAAVVEADMVTADSAGGRCLTIQGSDLANAPTLTLSACRQLPGQQWTHSEGISQWQSALDPNYCLGTVGNSPSPGGRLSVRACSDTRALTLQPDPADGSLYEIVGTDYVIDAGVYGYAAVAFKNGWSFQHWRWFQPALDLVQQYQHAVISYPLASTETLSYTIESARDQIARIQPPYGPPVTREPTLFPGVVPSNAPTVTRSFEFDLAFKDHGYLRMSRPPRNWMSTGLYAPADQIVRITVSNATAAELASVYVQLGVHTDELSPTSGNVSGGSFLRYPKVALRVELLPGENLVRTPYGGPIILGSDGSLEKSIQVEVANAVEAPRFVVGQTTEAEWLVLRNAPAPWGELESKLAVAHVRSNALRTMSFADALALAEHYSEIGQLHNELAGLSDGAALPHQTPQGKQRHVEDVQISAGYGHSGFPLMYFDDWPLDEPHNLVYRSGGWGVYHELGHNYQMGAWSNVYGTEVTVNLFSLYAQEKLFGNSRLVDANTYAQAIAILNDPAVVDKWAAGGPFEQLVFHEQLRLAFPELNYELWSELMRRYRELDAVEYAALNSDQAKRDKFMTLLCQITQTNLTPHFEAWTIKVTQAAKDECASYSPLTRQIWLIDGALPTHTGSGANQLLYERWDSVSGAAVGDLTASTAFPNQPSSSQILTATLEAPRNAGSSLGQRLRGFLHPPVSGDYRFWLSADDSAQLLLSTDEDPLNAQSIISLAENSGYRNFDDFTLFEQRSAPIALEAGQSYYIELLHKENGGSDHASVAWQIPATAADVAAVTPTTPATPDWGEVRKVIDGRFLSLYEGDLALRTQLAPGQPATIQPGDEVTFSIELLNQSSATVHNVELIHTLPAGFTLSTNDQNGWQTGYRYVRFVAESEAGERGGWASMAELGLLNAQEEPIDKSGWHIMYEDSAQSGQGAIYAIDDDPDTIWHTPWGGLPGYPHEVQIDTGTLHQFSGFTYLPRQSGSNGIVGAYRFFVSSDGITWFEVAAGTFADDHNPKVVPFTPPVSPYYYNTLTGPIGPQSSGEMQITLRASDTISDGAYFHSAEILSALDATGTYVRDSDSTYDANPTNDPFVDDALTNPADEDDHDRAMIQLYSGDPNLDGDSDGVADSVEALAPNNGDGNGDGIADAEQANVASIVDATGSSYVTLAASGECTSLTHMEALTATEVGVPDTQYGYPQGLVGYELACPQVGQSATVTLYWHGLSAVTNVDRWRLRKFGPTTPGDTATTGWADYPAQLDQVVVNGTDSLVRARLTLTDGQPGDATAADGRIVDPSGLASSGDIAMSATLDQISALQVGELISLTIRITNTSSAPIGALPLTVTYDVSYFSVDSSRSATPPADDKSDDGVINWGDLTGANFLAPGAAFEVLLPMTAIGETTLLGAQTPCTDAGETCLRISAGAGGVAPATVPLGVAIQDEQKSTLGNYVWLDVNGNGVKDDLLPGGVGMNGVRVNLYLDGANGNPQDGAIQPTELISSTLTITDSVLGDDTSPGLPGFYRFPIADNQRYLVEIDHANFNPGGPLEGMIYTGENALNGYNGTNPRLVIIGDGPVHYQDADFPFWRPDFAPALVLTKRLNTQEPLRVGELLSFTIQITNTGNVTITTLPLLDIYNRAFVGFVEAQPPATDGLDDGQLSWDNLAPVAGLPPQQALSTVVTFTALADTSLQPLIAPCDSSGEMCNLAKVQNAKADPDGPGGPIPEAEVPDVEAGDDVLILAPTAVQVDYHKATQTSQGVQLMWRTLSEVDIVGYQLWREVDGVKSRLSERIPAQYGGQHRSGDYSYLDSTIMEVPTGVIYFVEVHYRDGRTTWVELTWANLRQQLYLPLVKR